MKNKIETLMFNLEGIQVPVEVWWEPEFDYVEVKTPVGVKRFDYPRDISKEYYEEETIVTVKVGSRISSLIAKVMQGYLVLDEKENYPELATVVALRIDKAYDNGKLREIGKDNIIEIRWKESENEKVS